MPANSPAQAPQHCHSCLSHRRPLQSSFISFDLGEGSGLAPLSLPGNSLTDSRVLCLRKAWGRGAGGGAAVRAAVGCGLLPQLLKGWNDRRVSPHSGSFFPFSSQTKAVKTDSPLLPCFPHIVPLLELPTLGSTLSLWLGVPLLCPLVEATPGSLWTPGCSGGGCPPFVLCPPPLILLMRTKGHFQGTGKSH